MLDGTRAWMEATSLAMAGEGPAFALSRPAGHHATANVAMGFGLVNYAAAAVAARLAEAPDATVAILDWDVHHGNGVADIFKDEARVRYCSLHEVDNFPGTGLDEADRGPLGNLLNVPLPKETRSDAYLAALREKALPFLLGADGDGGGGAPELLLVCAGFDGLAADPLAKMALSPDDFRAPIEMVAASSPAGRVALGLEGGRDLDPHVGMPAGLVVTCAALTSLRRDHERKLLRLVVGRLGLPRFDGSWSHGASARPGPARALDRRNPAEHPDCRENLRELARRPRSPGIQSPVSRWNMKLAQGPITRSQKPSVSTASDSAPAAPRRVRLSTKVESRPATSTTASLAAASPAAATARCASSRRRRKRALGRRTSSSPGST